jgi:threonine dehydratase
MITANDIRKAAERLRGVAVVTPLLEYPMLNERVGGRILLKAETLQTTGSFKIRGAYNRISQITEAERARGLIAWSSGNHAQGVARAAQLVGTPAMILMPEDAPKTKIEGAKALGAEVIFFNRYTEDREEIGHRIAKERGLVLVPSYDDEHVIAGQGTCGLEIAQQSTAMGLELDQLLVCAGGGGLTSGCAIALADEMPNAKVYTVEPEGFDDIAQSLKKGERVRVDTSRKSIADALLPPTPGHLTWPILKTHVEKGLVVSETQIREAMRYGFRNLNLKIEPGGAVTLAAVLAGAIDVEDKVTAITLSGGNVDAEIFCGLIS